MKKLLIALSVLALSACANLSPAPKQVLSAVSHGDNKLLIVLTEDLCATKAIKDNFVDNLAPIAKDGRVLDLESGHVFKMCYVDGDSKEVLAATGGMSAGLYYLLDDDGRQGPLDKKDFKPGMPSDADLKGAGIEKLDI